MDNVETRESERYSFLAESLIVDLFRMYGCTTKKIAYMKDAYYDIYAEKGEKKFFVEVKAAHSITLAQSSIDKVRLMANSMSLKSNEYFVLVAVNMLPIWTKEYIGIKEQFIVIDISGLLYLVQNNEELKYRLLSLVEFTTENIELNTPEEFLQLLDVVEDEVLDSSTDGNREITKLLREINGWVQDGKTSAAYEKFCTKVLNTLFANDLTLWREQQRSNDDLYRFDLICKIKDGVTSAFWKFIEEYFRTKYIIFEFKDYKDLVTQKEIYTTEKYLYAKALRCVAIIVSCNGADENAKKAAKGTLRENGKLILNLSNQDLSNMLEYEINGNLASEYLYNILDEMLIELEK